MVHNKSEVHVADLDLSDADVEGIDLAEDVVIVDGERLTEERADQIAAEVLAKGRAYNAKLGGGRS